MIYRSALLLLIFYVFVSCSGTGDFRDGIEQLRSRPITLSFDKMRYMWNGKDIVRESAKSNTGLKLIVYLDTVACSSCELKALYMWEPMLEDVKMYGEDLSVHFIFSPLKRDLDLFYFTMRTMSPSQPVYVDTAGVFVHENPHIPREAMFHTFLLDGNNEVVLVGNPSRNETVKKLFWEIVEERLGKRK